MSLLSRNINVHQMMRSRMWPCDGVPRFSVGVNQSVTYSEAYQLILSETGSVKDETTKKITFTPEGLRRISALNARYYPLAKVFIYEHFMADSKRRHQEQMDEQKARGDQSNAKVAP